MSAGARVPSAPRPWNGEYPQTAMLDLATFAKHFELRVPLVRALVVIACMSCVLVLLIGSIANDHEVSLPALPAWFLVVSLLALATGCAVRGRPLMRSERWFVALASPAAVVLDAWGAWNHEFPSLEMRAAHVASFALVPCVALASIRFAVSVGAVNALIFVFVPIAHASDPSGAIPGAASGVVAALLPVTFFGIMIVVYSRLVDHALERTRSERALPHEAFTLGLRTSERLVEIDREAEQLLADVASGETPLPLSSERAAFAATLATDLRRHLIHSRTETWLVATIEDSPTLAAHLKLSDPELVAARITPPARRLLLAALWLLVRDVTEPIAIDLRDGEPVVLRIHTDLDREEAAHAIVLLARFGTLTADASMIEVELDAVSVLGEP